MVLKNKRHSHIAGMNDARPPTVCVFNELCWHFSLHGISANVKLLGAKHLQKWLSKGTINFATLFLVCLGCINIVLHSTVYVSGYFVSRLYSMKYGFWLLHICLTQNRFISNISENKASNRNTCLPLSNLFYTPAHPKNTTSQQ